MQLEVKKIPRWDDGDEDDVVEVIHPLEEKSPRWDNDEPVPTEQGELLLAFIKKHLFKP